MPTRAVSSIPKSTSSTHACSQPMKFPLDIMHNIFSYYISGEKHLASAFLLTHVCRHWRKAAHNLHVVWKDLILDAPPLRWQLSRSSQIFDTRRSMIPAQFSSLYFCIEIPSGNSRYAVGLISDCNNLRNLSIVASTTNDLDRLIETCDPLQWKSLKYLSIRNATEKCVKLCIPEAYIESLQSLDLSGLNGLRLPPMSSLETLVLSGSKKRILIDELVVFLRRGLPRLHTLELHGEPINFTSQLLQPLPALLPADALLCLTSLQIFVLRSMCENTHYLRCLLELLSPISTISSLQMEIEHELNDLNNMPHPMFPQHRLSGDRFSGLRTATFRLIKPKDCDLRGLLHRLACKSHATLRLSSHAQFILEFRPAELQAGLPNRGGFSALERVQFLFATYNTLRQFLDIVSSGKRGLKPSQRRMQHCKSSLRLGSGHWRP